MKSDRTYWYSSNSDDKWIDVVVNGKIEKTYWRDGNGATKAWQEIIVENDDRDMANIMDLNKDIQYRQIDKKEMVLLMM